MLRIWVHGSSWFAYTALNRDGLLDLAIPRQRHDNEAKSPSRPSPCWIELPHLGFGSIRPTPLQDSGGLLKHKVEVLRDESEGGP